MVYLWIFTGKYFILTSTYSFLHIFFVFFSQKNGIDFDHVYGWEMASIDPVKYWNTVPKKIFPFVHFMNAPISSNSNHTHSVLRMIRHLAKKEDFVSFKLDIDTSPIELAITLELLQHDDIADYVDEFFFELHFRCEVMLGCCWHNKIDESFGPIVLNRKGALQLFQQLRKRGIRAHIWP